VGGRAGESLGGRQLYVGDNNIGDNLVGENLVGGLVGEILHGRGICVGERFIWARELCGRGIYVGGRLGGREIWWARVLGGRAKNLGGRRILVGGRLGGREI